jgi:hypothetical protein
VAVGILVPIGAVRSSWSIRCVCLSWSWPGISSHLTGLCTTLGLEKLIWRGCPQCMISVQLRLLGR